jgi:hypothetical protein
VNERNVRDLANAVLDGEIIDWPAAWARLDPEEQTIAAHLRTLSRLGTSRHHHPLRSATRRLPWLLELGRGLAIVVTIIGLTSEAIAMWQVPSGRLGVLLALTVIFGVAASILDVGGKDRRTRALAVCYWTMAAAVATPGIRWLARQFPTIETVAVLAALHPDAFFASGLWQFGRDFPVLARFGAIDRLSLVAVRVTLLVATVLIGFNLVSVLAPGMATSLAPFQRVGGYGDWFWNLTFLAAAPALGVIAWRGRSATGQEAARVRLFLFSLVLCFLPLVIGVLAEGLSPAFARLSQSPAGQFWGSILVYTPIFVLPFATAYAIAVDNVLEVRVVIQRALRYLLARWLLMWGAAVPLALLLIYMMRQSARPLDEVMADPMARALTWAGASALVLLVFRRYAVRALDRWILPGIDEPAVILAQLTERMRQARTPLEVTAVLARAAERALQTPAQPYRAVDDVLVPIDSTAPPLPAHSLVRVVLEGSREPCIVSPQRRHSYFWLLSDRDRAWITDAGIVVLLPVISSRAGGGLIGMVALQERRNALAFSSDDMRFLRAGTAAAALACDLVHAGAERTASDQFEEFGLECTRCGRVGPRTATPPACECGVTQWATAALPKQLSGQFDIARRLGAGGMGIVYGGTDLRLGREVAVKTLTRLSEEAAQRLLIEARAMAELAHPNIAVLYGAEIWRATPLLIMEYMAGGTLAAALQKKPMSPAAALPLMTALAAALVHVHRLNQYHGDIKPSNIGFTRDGVIKFLDFGLSRTIVGAPDDDRDLAAPAGSPVGVAGTWAYMSPEVREGAAPGPILDVWALTIVLFECVTGKHPFAGSSRWQTSCDVPAALRLLPPELAPVFADFFEHAFAPMPSRYPNSAATLLNELERLDAPAVR